MGTFLPLNWLRVLRSAEAARIGPGVGQQRHTRAVRSEKCVRLRGRAWAGMRVIAVFFGPCAPDVLTAHGSVFSHNFKRLDRCTKLATSSFLGATGDLPRNGGQCCFGCVQQGDPLAMPCLGHEGVVTGHQPLARKLPRGDLRQWLVGQQRQGEGRL